MTDNSFVLGGMKTKFNLSRNFNLSQGDNLFSLNFKLILFTLYIGLFPFVGMGQKGVQDTLLMEKDSLDLMSVDTLRKDTIVRKFQGIKLSKDSLDAPVKYACSDSMVYDIKAQKIFLYGSAVVTYTTINLEADYLIFDWASNIVTAEGLPDSLGQMAGFPHFQDGTQEFTAKRMRYNFKTRKGVVYDVTTEQQGIIIHGARSKFEQNVAKDSTETTEEIICSENSIFTTCTNAEPHFGIRSRKQKIVAGKLVVVGPSNLEIMGIPTPLWLPFGMYPITDQKKAGLLFPNEYGYNQNWGMGMNGVGWFWPINDYFNLSLTGKVYVKGTWGASAASTYKKKYKYNGSFNFGFLHERLENRETATFEPSNSFSINWSHRQDPKAHPTTTLGGTVNFQLNNFSKKNSDDPREVLDNNILSSNFNFSKKWRDKPFSMTLGMSHNQNSKTGNISVSLPTFTFRTQTMYPFKLKERVGKERWYESVTLQYSAEAKNTLTGIDSTFFSQATLDDAKYGAKQKASTGTSIKLLKYFNFNPSASYEEIWYFKRLEKNFNPELEIDTTTLANGTTVMDTLSYGDITNDTIPGFSSFRSVNIGASLNTQLFLTKQFKGRFRGFRHVMKPSLSFNYRPDYTTEKLGWYKEVTDIYDPTKSNKYSIFDGGIYGTPSSTGKQMAISYRINNTFEGKYFSKRDSTDKKFKILRSLSLSGNYNFAAQDSFYWSRVSLRGNTAFFKNMTTLSFNASFDPYVNTIVRENDVTSIVRTREFYWDKNRKPVQFVNAHLSLTTNITATQIRDWITGEDDSKPSSKGSSNKKTIQEDDFFDLFKNFRISHNFGMDVTRISSATKKDTVIVTTNVIDMNGSIRLTDNWNLNIGRIGYDFKSKQVTYPSLGFTRDLHCWQMGMNWAPTRGSYTFYIRVKPGPLDFLEIPHNRNFRDGQRVIDAFN